MTTTFQIDPHYPIDVLKLPPSWAVVLLGDVVDDIRAGFASGEHNEDGRGIPHLRPMNIDRRGKITLYVLTGIAIRDSAPSPRSPLGSSAARTP